MAGTRPRAAAQALTSTWANPMVALPSEASLLSRWASVTSISRRKESCAVDDRLVRMCPAMALRMPETGTVLDGAGSPRGIAGL